MASRAAKGGGRRAVPRGGARQKARKRPRSKALRQTGAARKPASRAGDGRAAWLPPLLACSARRGCLAAQHFRKASSSRLVCRISRPYDDSAAPSALPPAAMALRQALRCAARCGAAAAKQPLGGAASRVAAPRLSRAFAGAASRVVEVGTDAEYAAAVKAAPGAPHPRRNSRCTSAAVPRGALCRRAALNAHRAQGWWSRTSPPSGVDHVRHPSRCPVRNASDAPDDALVSCALLRQADGARFRRAGGAARRRALHQGGHRHRGAG
jgi:hypothetical protein